MIGPIKIHLICVVDHLNKWSEICFTVVINIIVIYLHLNIFVVLTDKLGGDNEGFFTESMSIAIIYM